MPKVKATTRWRRTRTTPTQIIPPMNLLMKRTPSTVKAKPTIEPIGARSSRDSGGRLLQQNASVGNDESTDQRGEQTGHHRCDDGTDTRNSLATTYYAQIVVNSL
eukprot:m.121351 g.121351  ORF g.121351 m.121351 type:complete len:105 (+) comp13381_c0_seq2:4567-4881(+)